jgi:YVTN family beta-propeller protein
VIELDGANSQVVATISCGVIGVYIPFFGIRSGVEVDPTGQFLLVAASFDDQVKVIDTETNQIVKALDVGDFPLSIAFNAEGSIACVTNLFDDSFTLIQLDGANSDIIGTFPSQGQYPVDVDYQSVDDQFWICNYYNDRVAIFNANDGTQEGLVFMSVYGGAWSLEFHNENEPVYLTAGSETYNPAIVHGDSVFELPASASHLQIGQFFNGIYAVATIPGPDWVSLVELDFFESQPEISLESAPEVIIYPNPVSSWVTISSEKVIAELKIVDLSGRIIKEEEIGNDQITLNDLSLPAGEYILRLIYIDGSEAARKILCE